VVGLLAFPIWHVRPAGQLLGAARAPRDYLRSHPRDAAEYERLKRRLAEQHSHDRAAYTQAKEAFMWKLTRRADQWAQTKRVDHTAERRVKAPHAPLNAPSAAAAFAPPSQVGRPAAVSPRD
jgi:GrpB protein